MFGLLMYCGCLLVFARYVLWDCHDLNRQRYRVYVSGLRGVKVGRKNKEILTGVWFPETITIHVWVLYAGVLCQLTQLGQSKWLVI